MQGVRSTVSYLFIGLTHLQSLNKFMEDFVGKTRSAGVQLIVVLFPDKGDEIRNAVKRWGDVMHGEYIPVFETGLSFMVCVGFLTSHMKSDKLQRANPQYYANVAIKYV